MRDKRVWTTLGIVVAFVLGFGATIAAIIKTTTAPPEQALRLIVLAIICLVALIVITITDGAIRG